MRPIYLARMDKTRPVVVLTRNTVRDHRSQITVAPITSRRRGLVSEVSVGRQNGIDQDSVINCDNITTIDATALGSQLGFLLDSQEEALATAIHEAFDLDQ